MYHGHGNIHQPSSIQIYAQEMIDERREFPSKTERYDLLSALLDGSENEAEADRLTNEEIIGTSAKPIRCLSSL